MMNGIIFSICSISAFSAQQAAPKRCRKNATRNRRRENCAKVEADVEPGLACCDKFFDSAKSNCVERSGDTQGTQSARFEFHSTKCRETRRWRKFICSKHAASAFTVARGLFDPRFSTPVALAKHGRQLGWTRFRPARSLLSELVHRGCARVHTLGRRGPGPGEFSWTRAELHAGCGVHGQSPLDPGHVTQRLAPERSWPWKSGAVSPGPLQLACPHCHQV